MGLEGTVHYNVVLFNAAWWLQQFDRVQHKSFQSCTHFRVVYNMLQWYPALFSLPKHVILLTTAYTVVCHYSAVQFVTGELWGVFHENFRANWPRYNGAAMYAVRLLKTTQHHMTEPQSLKFPLWSSVKQQLCQISPTTSYFEPILRALSACYWIRSIIIPLSKTYCLLFDQIPAYGWSKHCIHCFPRSIFALHRGYGGWYNQASLLQCYQYFPKSAL